MAEVKKSGIVIKVFDYDDYDQIVTVLTSNEILTFIALGVRKMASKNRVALQLGNIIEVEIFEARLKGKLSKLKRASLVKQPPIKESDTALVLLEVIKYLNKIEEPYPELLKSIYESYVYLGGKYNHHLKTFIVSKVLKSLGQDFNVSSCVECGRVDRINGFDFYKGGFTCVFHSQTQRNLEYLKAAQALKLSVKNFLEVSYKNNSILYKELKNFIDLNNF